MEGVLGSGAKDYTVPSISVNGINADAGQAFGVGFAQGDFIQHNYHWRDVLTHVKGAHTLKFGYEGWYGDDVEPFQGPWSQPKFAFNNLLKLAQDAPTNEGGIMYNPATGTQKLWNWDAASRTFGLFVEDTWKARRNLTLTLGLRYDDSGNPWSKSATTVFGNFYLGTGTTEQQQIANGYAKATHNALLHSVDNLFSPRVGVAWDPTGKGDWAVRGGFGIYNNWLTQANVQEEFRGSPPGLVMPTFFAGGKPPRTLPSSFWERANKPPFGFTFPTFQGAERARRSGRHRFRHRRNRSALKSPKSDIWSLSVERRSEATSRPPLATPGPTPTISSATAMPSASSATAWISTFLPGDLITEREPRSDPAQSQLRIDTYSDNNRYGNYNGVFFDLKGRFSRGFVMLRIPVPGSKDERRPIPTR